MSANVLFDARLVLPHPTGIGRYIASLLPELVRLAPDKAFHVLRREDPWPGYRLEWQTFGSLHRRLRDCDAGVRAEPHAAGSDTYTNLELYLAWRARSLPLESPGVRR